MSTIKIKVYLFASLCKLNDKVKELTKEKKEFELEIKSGTTIKDLINFLELPEKAVQMYVLNSQKVEATTVLNEGDNVGLYPLIGGG